MSHPRRGKSRHLHPTSRGAGASRCGRSGPNRGEVLAIPADVTKREDIEAFIAKAAEHYGRIDILVNNAGRAAAKKFEDIAEEEWVEDIDLKFTAAVRCTRAVLPHMRKVGGGRIINVTHPGGKAPGARSLPTSVSRAAGIALTKALSTRLC